MPGTNPRAKQLSSSLRLSAPPFQLTECAPRVLVRSCGLCGMVSDARGRCAARPAAACCCPKPPPSRMLPPPPNSPAERCRVDGPANDGAAAAAAGAPPSDARRCSARRSEAKVNGLGSVGAALAGVRPRLRRRVRVLCVVMVLSGGTCQREGTQTTNKRQSRAPSEPLEKKTRSRPLTPPCERRRRRRRPRRPRRAPPQAPPPRAP